MFQGDSGLADAVTIVDLIRHGEPVGGSKYRGQIDDPLSDKGWRQMRDAVADHCPWNSIVSSSLSRCSAFAKELSLRHDLPLNVDDRLKEIGFGEWEGKTKDEISSVDAEILQRFYNNPIEHRPPGAETLSAFETRVVSAWNDVLKTHSGEHVLLVGHAGVIRVVMCHVLKCPVESMFHIYVANASITRIRVDGSGDNAMASLMFHDGQLG